MAPPFFKNSTDDVIAGSVQTGCNCQPVGDPIADYDDRGVGVSPRYLGDDWCIGHSDPADTPHLALLIYLVSSNLNPD